MIRTCTLDPLGHQSPHETGTVLAPVRPPEGVNLQHSGTATDTQLARMHPLRRTCSNRGGFSGGRKRVVFHAPNNNGEVEAGGAGADICQHSTAGPAICGGNLRKLSRKHLKCHFAGFSESIKTSSGNNSSANQGGLWEAKREIPPPPFHRIMSGGGTANSSWCQAGRLIRCSDLQSAVNLWSYSCQNVY